MMSDELKQEDLYPQNKPLCPKCGSEKWVCFDESTEYFEDHESGEIYESPVGYLICKDCGTSYGHHYCHPDKWLGTYEDVYGDPWDW